MRMRSSTIMFDTLSSASQWVGTAAAVLTTCSFLPQAFLTLRSQDVSGISAGMYSMFTAGVALWLVYGYLLGEWPIIIANAVTLTLCSLILITKLRVDRHQRRKRQGPEH
jgi:MtN3 and saliva related transmembrane protein